MPRPFGARSIRGDKEAEQMTQTWLQEAKPGDVVTTSRNQVGAHARLGEIVELLGAPGHERLRMRWEDERETIFFPGPDAAIRHMEHRH
jgi:signal recognition particle receptor subunit beta